MPFFYFDVTDRDGRHYDCTDLDLPDVDAARQVLEMTLPRVSAEHAHKIGPAMTLLMTVRDAHDQEVLQAVLDWTVTTWRLDVDRRLPTQRVIVAPGLGTSLD